MKDFTLQRRLEAGFPGIVVEFFNKDYLKRIALIFEHFERLVREPLCDFGLCRFITDLHRDSFV